MSFWVRMSKSRGDSLYFILGNYCNDNDLPALRMHLKALR